MRLRNPKSIPLKQISSLKSEEKKSREGTVGLKIDEMRFVTKNLLLTALGFSLNFIQFSPGKANEGRLD